MSRPWHKGTPAPHLQPVILGQFDTFDDWCNHASRALTGFEGSMGEELKAICVDNIGRRCNIGKDFYRARDEGTFPVRYFTEMKQQPAPTIPIELDGVAEALAGNEGFWRSCSGCHEYNEGVPLGQYSSILKCYIGMGCRECGGIGAIWDTTDYEAMGEAIASQPLRSANDPL